jgi:hypothetical protein
MLASMLALGELPDTKECAVCARLTGCVVWAELLDQLPEEQLEPEVAVAVATTGCFFILVNALANVFMRPEPKRPAGYAVWVRIPVRCCETCARSLTNPKLREALRRHPVTAGVLDKYPELRVWRAR